VHFRTFLFIYLKACHKHELGRLNQVRIIRFSYWSANQKQDLSSDWPFNSSEQTQTVCVDMRTTIPNDFFELHNEYESLDISHPVIQGKQVSRSLFVTLTHLL